MALDELEQKLYADIVKVVNRTDSPVEFMYDSKLYVIGEKGRNMPRFIAEHGIAKNATSFDANGFPTGSLLGIEGDEMWITTPLTNEEVKTLEDSDKFGDEVIDGGKVVKKTKVSLKQPKENFSVNNL